MNGKLCDVSIEELTYKDGLGFDRFLHLTVFMDKSAVEHVKSIPGVDGVYNSLGHRYSVYLDPRYDREYLKREIEAQAKIHAEE